MGQKVNPTGFRLGVNKTWDSKWYVKPSKYVDILHEDLKIKQAVRVMPEVESADVSTIEISRNPQRVTVYFHTAKPGILIGKNGANIDKLTQKIAAISGKKSVVKVVEIAKPNLDARILSTSIARQIAARGSYKRILKKAVADCMRDGAKGIKIRVSGRLNGAEIARSDSIKEGRVPLHTLRSNIDYSFSTADTSYGSIGVKVWVYTGSANAKNESRADAGDVVRRKKEEKVGNDA